MTFENKDETLKASGETVYTCPMHPEVQSNEPGKCPKCGMFLVAKTDADDSAHKHEASDETSGGCCGGHGHEHGAEHGAEHAGHASGGGCCGGHKGEHAHQ